MFMLRKNLFIGFMRTKQGDQGKERRGDGALRTRAERLIIGSWED